MPHFQMDFYSYDCSVKFYLKVKKYAERPCKDREGGRGSPPPYLFWLWSQFWLNCIYQRASINFYLLGPFIEFFPKITSTKWWKLKNYQKLLLEPSHSILFFCNWGNIGQNQFFIKLNSERFLTICSHSIGFSEASTNKNA